MTVARWVIVTAESWKMKTAEWSEMLTAVKMDGCLVRAAMKAEVLVVRMALKSELRLATKMVEMMAAKTDGCRE